jgi:hypothetical protein
MLPIASSAATPNTVDVRDTADVRDCSLVPGWQGSADVLVVLEILQLMWQLLSQYFQGH